MTPMQRQLAQRIFEEAIRAGSPDPAMWIASQTVEQPVVEEVLRLLAARGSNPTHAESQEVSRPTRLADPLIGTVLGAYRVERLIGTGGMGRVYLALSTTDESVHVAIKVLGRFASGAVAMQRFAREAEVLEKLRHPAIAAFYATGRYDDGEGPVPWLAMEAIPDAVDLATWCESKRLGVRERIALVAEVSDAIGLAHRMGIVHRDLKPANILVTAHGEPKVIDFGVARCIGGESSLGAAQTQTGQLVGTMQYMSPEQFVGDPRKIDERADVYALGVILFELLSEQYPHEVRALPITDAARLVCDVDAPDIRSVVSDIDEALALIVANALCRDRSARIENARALNEQLRNWLRGNTALPAESARASSHASHTSHASHAPHALESQSVAKSAGWFIPTLSVSLVVLVGLIATGVVTPVSIMRLWRTLTSATTQGAALDPSSATATEPISIESEPAGARITIDGRDVGTTPYDSTISWTASSLSATIVISKVECKSQTHVIAAAPRGGRTAPLQMRVRLDPVSVPNTP